MAQTTDIKATRIMGGVGYGKTQTLIDRIRHLLEGGTDPASVLVACATPQAGLAFRQRLAKACGDEAARNVAVTTPRAVALDVLSDAEARRWSGREPRLLTAYEELFLLEDMKVSGLRPKRLREMLKFFYRSWTELADDDEKWLLAGEETNIHELLKANLALTQAIAEPEAANLAVNYLRAHDGARAAHSFAHVFVDDYQLISRASQMLMSLVARDSLTVAGNRVACVSIYDSYPYAAGLDEFAKTHRNQEDIQLTASHRCPASSAAAQRLLADPALAAIASNNSGADDAANEPQPEGADGAEGGSCDDGADAAFAADEDGAFVSDASASATPLTFDLPEDEFLGIADYVSQAISDGCLPEDIVVATPNGIWSRNVAKALASRKVPVETLADRQPVRGDIRDYGKCVPARILTALDLVADPGNALAWRCWCGYGDWLANSSAMASLRAYANDRGSGLVEALTRVFDAGHDAGDAAAAGAAAEAVRAAGAAGAAAAGNADRNASRAASAANDATAEPTDNIVGAQRVADAHKAGLAMLAAAKGLASEELLAKLTEIVTEETGAPIPQVIRALCLEEGHADGQSGNSAEAMAARFRTRLLSPTVSNTGTVKVLPYDQCVGLSPKVLIISGFVNGFIPCRAYFDGAEMPLDKQEREHEKDARRVYALAGKANDRLMVSRFTNTDLESAGVLKLHIGRIRLRDGVRMCQIPASDFTEQLVPTESGF